MLVLDVACGPGYVSAAAKQLGAIPTGIDFSEKMVAIAKRMFPEIRFMQGDAHELPFEDEQFRSCAYELSGCCMSHNQKKHAPKHAAF